MPSDQTIQMILSQGVTGVLVLMALVICGMVLLMIMQARVAYMQVKENRDARQRHDKQDDESLRARIDHTKELTRLSDYVQASIVSQKSIQQVMESNIRTIQTIDANVSKTEATAVGRYNDVMVEVQKYTIGVGQQLDLLPVKLRNEIRPVIDQLNAIESALSDSQKKTAEIGLLLRETEATLLKAIQGALAPPEPKTALMLIDGIG